MLIADSQVHIWAAEAPGRPWAPAGMGPHRAHPLGAAELLRDMDRAGVDRAFVVPPTWEGHRNDVVVAAAEEHPDRLAAIIRFPIDDPASAPEIERLYTGHRGVLGARLVFHGPTAGWLADGTAEWFWPVAERLGMPVMVFAAGQVGELGRVAAEHPRVRIALCHLGLDIALRDEETLGPIRDVLALARHPNVAVKASSLPCYVSESYPFPLLHGPVQQVVAAFGPSRVFWGSDLTRLTCTYRQLVTLFTEEMTFLSEDDLDEVMGEALCDWFDWPAPSCLPSLSERRRHGVAYRDR